MHVEPIPLLPDDVDPTGANFVVYENHADHYRERAAERYAGTDGWLLPILGETGGPPSARALDVGCAVGTTARYLAKHGYTVTGLDFSPRMVSAARAASMHSGLDNVPTFICMDFRTWALTGEQFDLVVATAFVHLFPEPQDRWVVETLLAHVAPGGTAVVSTTIERIHSQQLRAKEDYDEPPGLERWRNHYTEASFRNLVQSAARTVLGDGCVIRTYSAEDPARPGKFWSDIAITRTH